MLRLKSCSHTDLSKIESCFIIRVLIISLSRSYWPERQHRHQLHSVHPRQCSQGQGSCVCPLRGQASCQPQAGGAGRGPGSRWRWWPIWWRRRPLRRRWRTHGRRGRWRQMVNVVSSFGPNILYYFNFAFVADHLKDNCIAY